MYKEGRYEESLAIALGAHEKAKLDAEEEWKKLLQVPPTELAKFTKMWDTTTQKYLSYDEYIAQHNWEDDIPPAPMRIAEKSRRKLK